jgi:hypothetical protein
MSALDDIVIVIEWLASSKTATGAAAEALERLRNRSTARDRNAGDERPKDIE